jgi:pilus assembly protein Flp/PilA
MSTRPGVRFLEWSYQEDQKGRKVSMLASIMRPVVEFLQREDGPTAVEYAVMLALIIAVCIAAIQSLGSSASNTFSFVATKADTTGS